MRLKNRLVMSCMTALVAWVLSSASVGATKWPNQYLTIRGNIVDFDSGKPVEGATVLVFVNDSPYADNNGWISAGQPERPSRTALDGAFSARAILYRGPLPPKELKLETVVLKDGYRTERFQSLMVDLLLPKDPNATAAIQLPPMKLLKLRKQ